MFAANFAHIERIMKRSFLALLVLVAVLDLSRGAQSLAQDQRQQAANDPKAGGQVGEKVPSEDVIIKDLHSLGLIEGHANIFRSASPVRDLVDDSGELSPDASSDAKKRMQHLYDLGIRTVISFENPNQTESNGEDGKAKATKSKIALEKAAAEQAGLKFVSHPITNSGKNSLEDMSDADVCKLLDPISQEILDRAGEGGVLFHCSAGHDRTGIMAAYMRLKYQHWPVDQAIDEMRRFGHNWPKFSANGGSSSWHEEHLKTIDKQLKQSPP